ncbi:MAG: adenylate/guanylate cyclase protein, partial [Rhodoferax sp.]|nr:adenylate/guanylate cyclase protein [Rhodoferax sp.]
TLDGCAGTRVRRVGRLVLKGKTEPLQVCQPLNDGLEGAVDAERLAAYDAAYDLMVASSPEALPAFEALAAQDPQDPLVRLHQSRLQRGIAASSGSAWDVLVMDEK